MFARWVKLNNGSTPMFVSITSNFDTYLRSPCLDVGNIGARDEKDGDCR
ncbi:MAG: hypothetical protein AAF268_06820 [Cyanobacteria bacterium P01_A01_bin.3]